MLQTSPFLNAIQGQFYGKKIRRGKYHKGKNTTAMLHILAIIPDILSDDATKTIAIYPVIFMIHNIFMQFTLIYYKYRVN
ncbi:hypothetical protein C5472_08245 [Photorhabdus sp. RW14-46]|nr:hypothetical protein A4R40_07675 [Photorhabdus laumondii subsp. laumondii]NHB61126.1 hypothetical protein [Photorhabdus sp. RW14-46]RAW74237.1 hypothetical protein CKY14_06510 [Photorhabdus sp. S14-60]RAW74791.1 hypothetical protein CKY15_03230 [Photorhabdus sp. S7-51]RAW80112.1 hypothetical protein CKY06_02750 [Photorhabdus sp. S15-56]RAW88793.1 hypothetical protein CKY09_02495 [Photorhabdus sp. S5P8-50]RAW89068.1 hypothetical protein CKY12_02095 [Photorhabdus sp. S12-55]